MDANINEITPSQLAKIKKCSVQYIHRLLKEGKKIPEVSRVKKYGRFYVLKLKKQYQ